jgi:DNA-binding GntR family transcriptional regulator
MKNIKITRVDDAYNKLKNEIAENRMSPGNPMLEQEIAEYLGMSRTPVREALLRLEAEGLVEVVPRRGVKILPVSKDDMKEIYEIFLSLEPIAAAGLANRKDLTKKDFKELEKATDDMEKALAQNDLDAWAQADYRFHTKIIEMHGNKRLINILDMLRNQTHRVRLLTRNFRNKPTKSVEEHREILQFIYNGDSENALKSFRKHRERTVKEIMGILEKLQLQNV